MPLNGCTLRIWLRKAMRYNSLPEAPVKESQSASILDGHIHPRLSDLDGIQSDPSDLFLTVAVDDSLRLQESRKNFTNIT
jgi:hypothetical protein